MRVRDLPTVEVSTRLSIEPTHAWDLVTDIALPTRAAGELHAVTWAGVKHGCAPQGPLAPVCSASVAKLSSLTSGRVAVEMTFIGGATRRATVSG